MQSDKLEVISLERTALLSNAFSICYWITKDGFQLSELHYPELKTNGIVLTDGLFVNYDLLSSLKVDVDFMRLNDRGRYFIPQQERFTNNYIESLLLDYKKYLIKLCNALIKAEKKQISKYFKLRNGNLDSLIIPRYIPTSDMEKKRSIKNIVNLAVREIRKYQKAISSSSLISIHKVVLGDKSQELLTSKLCVFYSEHSEIAAAFQLLLVDKLFQSLVDQDRSEGLLASYQELCNYNELINPGYSKKISLEVFARENQAKSQERFHIAKNIAKQFAENCWSEDSTLRYGVIAKDIKHLFDDNVSEIGINPPPNIKTIKGWIKSLAPNEDCLKGGRPPKT